MNRNRNVINHQYLKWLLKITWSLLWSRLTDWHQSRDILLMNLCAALDLWTEMLTISNYSIKPSGLCLIEHALLRLLFSQDMKSVCNLAENAGYIRPESLVAHSLRGLQLQILQMLSSFYARGFTVSSAIKPGTIVMDVPVLDICPFSTQAFWRLNSLTQV